MYRKRILVLLFAVGIAIHPSWAQNVKTYSGPYQYGTDMYDFPGTATYQYYENENYERIYHGSFVFINDRCNVVGTYKNNLKEGVWTYSELFNYSKRYTSITTGKFTAGLMDGSWTYSKVDYATKATIKRSSVTFISGAPVGAYTYYDKGEAGNAYTDVKVVGQYDSTSVFVGEWVVTYKEDGQPFEQRSTYSNGVRLQYIHRNLATGAIIERQTVNPNEDPNTYYDKGLRLNDYCKSFWQCIGKRLCPDNPVFYIAQYGANFLIANSNKQ